MKLTAKKPQILLQNATPGAIITAYLSRRKSYEHDFRRSTLLFWLLLLFQQKVIVSCVARIFKFNLNFRRCTDSILCSAISLGDDCMIAVLKHGTTQEQTQHLVNWLKNMGMDVRIIHMFFPLSFGCFSADKYPFFSKSIIQYFFDFPNQFLIFA